MLILTFKIQSQRETQLYLNLTLIYFHTSKGFSVETSTLKDGVKKWTGWGTFQRKIQLIKTRQRQWTECLRGAALFGIIVPSWDIAASAPF